MPLARAAIVVALAAAISASVVAWEANQRSDSQPQAIRPTQAEANATLRAVPAVVFENPCASTRYTVRYAAKLNCTPDMTNPNSAVGPILGSDRLVEPDRPAGTAPVES